MCITSRTILKIGRLITLLCLISGSAFGQTLRIYQIDVEQGDATLVISPSGKTLLIDSGDKGHDKRIKAVMMDAGLDTIDYFVCTHFHKDHYGGIVALVKTIPVMYAYDRGKESSLMSDSYYVNYQNAIGEWAIQINPGETIPFDPDLSVKCIASGSVVLGEEDSNAEADENENNNSVALLIQYEGFRYFNGGDIEAKIEQKVADRDLVLDMDLYKSSHHGAKTSSSGDFMDDLKPSVIVISNGNHGGYKHPQQSTLDFYAGMDIAPAVFQTNKYLKGGNGGNVDDEFIADLESTDTDGTILVTVDASAGSYTVAYRDKSKTFPMKAATVSGTGESIVIESVLPNPEGQDRELEEVSLRNKGAEAVSVIDWRLEDKNGKTWTLASMGTIPAGQSATIVRGGMPMDLNNNSDDVMLFNSGNQLQDQFSYTGSSEGLRILTGH